MAVITISRLLGSGGTTIARLVAKEFGFNLLDRELPDLVAERAGVSQSVTNSLDEKTFDWASGLLYSIVLGISGQQFNQESYRIMVTRLIREASARESIVILGRAGQVVLGFRPDTYHVHIVAPLVDRISRLMTRDNITPEEARRQITESDENRRRFIYSIGQRDWSDPTLYDLIINTQRQRPELAAEMIVSAVRRGGIVK